MSRASRAPAAGRHGGSGSGGSGVPNLSIGPAAGGDPTKPVSLGPVDVDLGLSLELAVPGVALVVPGLLLILAVLAQSLGALAWLPFVRRSLGDQEPQPGRRRRTYA